MSDTVYCVLCISHVLQACWMLHYFSEIQFSHPENLQYGLQQVFNCLTQDKELPVKVEAAVALQFLIKHQEMAQEFVQPHVKPIIQVHVLRSICVELSLYNVVIL